MRHLFFASLAVLAFAIAPHIAHASEYSPALDAEYNQMQTISHAFLAPNANINNNQAIQTLIGTNMRAHGIDTDGAITYNHRYNINIQKINHPTNTFAEVENIHNMNIETGTFTKIENIQNTNTKTDTFTEMDNIQTQNLSTYDAHHEKITSVIKAMSGNTQAYIKDIEHNNNTTTIIPGESVSGVFVYGRMGTLNQKDAANILVYIRESTIIPFSAKNGDSIGIPDVHEYATQAIVLPSNTANTPVIITNRALGYKITISDTTLDRIDPSTVM